MKWVGGLGFLLKSGLYCLSSVLLSVVACFDFTNTAGVKKTKKILVNQSVFIPFFMYKIGCPKT